MMRSTPELRRHCRLGSGALAYARRDEKTVLPLNMIQKPPTPEQAERAARRAEALRANLRRRKAAARKEAAPVPDKDTPGNG